MANHTQCSACKDMLYINDLYSSINNPHGFEIKNGRDFGPSLTINDIIKTLVDSVTAGDSDVDIALSLDEVFLFGCWRNELECRSPDMLRDLRGLIVSLAKKAATK